MEDNRVPCIRAAEEETSECNENDSTVVNPPSNFIQYYKNTSRTTESSIQQRREAFLSEHKEKHDAFIDENRDLSKLFEETDISANEAEEEEMDHEITYTTTERSRQKKPILFKMSWSEWFNEIPDDLVDKWLVKFCPEGKRRLVVANKRFTKCFDKFGYHIFNFQSKLPGGGGVVEYSTHHCGLTVLDCIFHEASKTFFVMDMLVWNSLSFIDCEAELRLCFLRSKYVECPERFEAYGIDSYGFEVLTEYVADPEIIQSEMFLYSSKHDGMCDGLIFYHKEAPYIRGPSCLVTWLKPFMLAEKLNIRVPIEYKVKKPEGYINLQSFLEKLAERKQKTRRKKKAPSECFKMEAEEAEVIIE